MTTARSSTSPGRSTTTTCSSLAVQGERLFACALEGWAFRLNDFAKLYSKKLRCNEA